MDHQTLVSLAGLICGDSPDHPKYRKGHELTEFFHNVGFSNFAHDGSTRKWWTLGVLDQLTENNLKAVICRLADPHEYQGDKHLTLQAVARLNQILLLEGLGVKLDGVQPALVKVTPSFQEEPEREPELVPLPPPDFLALSLEPSLGAVLANRWTETQTCVNSGSFLAATILMGSLLEGLLLAVFQKHPQQANICPSAPTDHGSCKVKHFADWSLSDMINVAHECGWIGLDVKKFSHALREFRNLIHPYQQWTLKTFPDADTCGIGWLVVQAAVNDLAAVLR